MKLFFGKDLQKVSRTKLPDGVRHRKSKAQSLVEFAIALPILLILLTGVVEFGFALNIYLSLMDASREAARFYSDQQPYEVVGGSYVDNDAFYTGAFGRVRFNLDPQLVQPSYVGRRIPLDPARDDVIVVVYTKHTNPSTGVTTIIQHPNGGARRLYGNHPLFNTQAKLSPSFIAGSPDAGILVVEVVYTYHHVLQLPWLAPLDPMTMRAYTIMPNRWAEVVP